MMAGLSEHGRAVSELKNEVFLKKKRKNLEGKKKVRNFASLSKRKGA